MRRLNIIALIILLAFVFVGCTKQEIYTVAIINGQEITNVEYDNRYNFVRANYEIMTGTKVDDKKDKDTVVNLRDMAFEDIILQVLLIQEAEKNDIEVTEEEINDTLEYIKKNKDAEEKNGYKNLLKELQITEKELIEELRMDQIYWKLYDLITKDVNVSTEEAKAFYDQNNIEFQRKGGIQTFHILVEDKVEAQDIIERIKSGEDFEKLAKDHSTCPSRDYGGDLGFINESSNFDSIFKGKALSLSTGQMTDEPLKTDFGYHVIKAGEIKEDSIIPFEEVSNDIIAKLQNEKKLDTFNKYVANLRDTADVKDLRN